MTEYLWQRGYGFLALGALFLGIFFFSGGSLLALAMGMLLVALAIVSLWVLPKP